MEARRLVWRFGSPEELREAFAHYVASGAPEAYVMYRELDYFEQLAALEHRGAFDFELIRLLLGRTLVTRWELWRPAIQAAHGADAYPLFADLAEKLRRRRLRPDGRDRLGLLPAVRERAHDAEHNRQDHQPEGRIQAVARNFVRDLDRRASNRVSKAHDQDDPDRRSQQV